MPTKTPQLGGSNKAKSRDGRQSWSRQNTPNSNISIPINSNTASHTSYLQIDLGSLMVPTNVTYEHLLNQHGGGQGIPDPASLNQMVDNLKMLGQLAEERSRVCDGGMRELSKRRKERVEEERRLDQENRDREEKASLKRAAEEEEARGRKSLKTKKGKKERSSVREEPSTVRQERPLAVGAHGLARQDGRESTPQSKCSLSQWLFPSAVSTIYTFWICCPSLLSALFLSYITSMPHVLQVLAYRPALSYFTSVLPQNGGILPAQAPASF